ncbi:MAG TPA: hypothetical protein VMP08_06160 [Anaerolineae bacterium]|nr:hypothetical protein [Anaerolineae bacterium]
MLMAEAFKPPTAVQLLRDLQHSAELRHQPSAADGLLPQLALLREWQANRLTHTYVDLRVDPHYRPACEFFLSDIYAPRDFSQRDHDLDRIHKFLSRVLPATTIQLLTMTVELNRLTNTLDNHLRQVLVDQISVTDTITPEQYIEAYRRCDNKAERICQIGLIQSILKQVSKGTHRSIVSAALKMAKTPAHRAGWVDVYDFLERGYLAFRQMKDATKFVEAIGQRETRILDLIYADDVAGFKKLAGLS